ncbi:type IV pilin protein [Alteromonas oceani]|uniref:Type IV pilin protein n=1 Tax=Alteromonas oceani TaxID=2071609 RepID=A0ABV7K1F9_9ALTE|nr:type IV pilin protein [Alteromonas oceani]
MSKAQRTHYSLGKETGVGMVEILVSLFVLTIGLLGVASLQFTGTFNNVLAASRSQAELVARYVSEQLVSAAQPAQADLMGFASAMERHYATTFSYAGAASGGSDTGAPAVFAAHSPSTEPAGKKKYTLTIHAVSADGSSYELRAVPVSGSPQAGDGTLYYFSDGRKAWDQNSDGSIGGSEYCWSC